MCSFMIPPTLLLTKPAKSSLWSLYLSLSASSNLTWVSNKLIVCSHCLWRFIGEPFLRQVTSCVSAFILSSFSFNRLFITFNPDNSPPNLPFSFSNHPFSNWKVKLAALACKSSQFFISNFSSSLFLSALCSIINCINSFSRFSQYVSGSLSLEVFAEDIASAETLLAGSFMGNNLILNSCFCLGSLKMSAVAVYVLLYSFDKDWPSGPPEKTSFLWLDSLFDESLWVVVQLIVVFTSLETSIVGSLTVVLAA